MDNIPANIWLSECGGTMIYPHGGK
jgi:hypothetical protein